MELMAAGAVIFCTGFVGGIFVASQALKQSYKNLATHQEDIKRHYVEIGRQIHMLAGMKASVGLDGQHPPQTLN